VPERNLARFSPPRDKFYRLFVAGVGRNCQQFPDLVNFLCAKLSRRGVFPLKVLALGHDDFPYGEQLPPPQCAIARSVWPTTVSAAIPVVKAKARAKMKAIFFMVSPLWLRRSVTAITI
jgi:hypothetical protein